MEELTKDMSEKLNRIRESVMNKAQLECGAIQREMDDYHEQKLNKYRGNFSAEITRQMEADIKNATRDADVEIARHKAELKKALYAFRMQKSEAVFAEAKENLIHFTDSDAYEADLRIRAERARAHFGDESLVLKLREADRRFAPMLQEIVGRCTVEYTTQIRIGGLMLCNENGLIADESLDTAFASAKAQFFHTCGVILAG